MVDNGGAVATRGFNFQKSCAIYTIMLYKDNNSFSIIPEADEDFQFEVNGEKYFVQAKTTKNLTVNDISRRKKNKEGTSIIEKNLIVGTEEDFRWLFFCNWSLSDNNKLNVVHEHEHFKPLLKYTDKHIENIQKKLNLNSVNMSRLKEQRIYEPEFKDNAEVNLRYLNMHILDSIEDDSIMTNSNVLTSINSELWTLLDIKSEKTLSNPPQEEEYELKSITHDNIKKIFGKLTLESTFAEILENLNLSTIETRKIKFSRLKINTQYSHLIDDVINQIKISDLESINSDNEIIEFIKNIISDNTNIVDNDFELSALAIYCYGSILNRS